MEMSMLKYVVKFVSVESEESRTILPQDMVVIVGRYATKHEALIAAKEVAGMGTMTRNGYRGDKGTAYISE